MSSHVFIIIAYFYEQIKIARQPFMNYELLFLGAFGYSIIWFLYVEHNYHLPE